MIRDNSGKKSKKKKNEAFSKGDLLDFGSSGGGPMGYTSQGGNGGARKKEKNRNEKMEYIQKINEFVMAGIF